MNALFPFNQPINQSHIIFSLLLHFAEKVVHLGRLTSIQIHVVELGQLSVLLGNTYTHLE